MSTNRREVLGSTLALAVRTALGGGLATTLASCGGGGGSGSSSSSTPAPSSLSYSTPVSASVGTAITSLSPSVSGTVTSYSVSPALPAGLTLNTTTGTISGTPTAAAPQATYTITAANSGGQTTFALSLTVLAGLAISSVSSATPTALTPVTLSMIGLDPTQAFTVNLTNGADVNLKTQIVSAASDGSQIVIAAPLYIDPTTGMTANLTASVAVTQGSLTSNAVQLNISDLPSVASYGVNPGDISRAFLNQLALGFALNVNALQAVAALPSAKTDTSTVQAHLAQQQRAALEARDNVDLLVSGSQSSLAVGTTSAGLPIQFNSYSVDAMDRVLAMYLQYLRAVPSSIYAPLSASQPPSVTHLSRKRLRATMHMPVLREEGEAPDTQSKAPALHLHASSPFQTLINLMGTTNGALSITNSAVTLAGTPSVADQYIAIGQGLAQGAIIVGALAAAPELIGAGVLVGTLYGVAAMANDGYKWYTSSQAIDNAVNAGDPTALAQAEQNLSNARANFGLDTIGTALGVLGFPSELAGDVGLAEDVVTALSTNQNGLQGVAVQGLGLLTGATSLLVTGNQTLADLDAQAVQSSDGDIPTGTDPFGLIDGTCNIDNTASPYLLPLDGVQLADLSTGDLFQTSAGTDDSYQMIVPLGVTGMDYSAMQLSPYDPISGDILGSAVSVDLSTLTAGNAATEPNISGVCSDADAGAPDEDDPDCD